MCCNGLHSSETGSASVLKARRLIRIRNKTSSVPPLIDTFVIIPSEKGLFVNRRTDISPLHMRIAFHLFIWPRTRTFLKCCSMLLQLGRLKRKANDVDSGRDVEPASARAGPLFRSPKDYKRNGTAQGSQIGNGEEKKPWRLFPSITNS